MKEESLQERVVRSGLEVQHHDEVESEGVRIVKLWFGDNEICIRTDRGGVYGKALEFFPALKNATVAQRERYVFGPRRDTIHWPELDEDIHLAVIMEEAAPLVENRLTEVFGQFPELSVRGLACRLNMHPVKLYHFIYGVRTPTQAREKEVIEALHAIGKRLLSL